MKTSSKKVLSVLLALVMVLSMLSMSALAATGDMSNPVTPVSGLTLRFGDTSEPTWPENCMYFKETGSNTYDAVYSENGTTVSTNYYPSILSFYAIGATSITGTDIDFVTYDDDGNPTTSSTVALNSAGAYTIQPKSSNSKIVVNGSITVNFSAPVTQTVTGGTTPAFVNGYLPLGQYASGAAWGSIFTSYTNVNGLNATDAVTKITGGYASTGISLGSPGGYVQFEFAGDGIENDPDNKYGIDFVIYGNPFNGNPEAGSVKVSQNGSDWYELAGSRYYNSETIRNTSISYKMTPTSTYQSDKKVNIEYKIGNGNWTTYKSNVVWWPESETEGYGAVSGVNDALDGTTAVSDVTYEKTGSNSYGDIWTVTYGGVTLVKDSDTTDDYLFGYADVRAVGSKDGAACNPYATVPTSGADSDGNGGDGFDISWAVNENGEPVNLSKIKFVRIYTSAALSPNDLTIMPTPGIFGETSTEVCGVFAAKETGSGAATTDLVVKRGTKTITTNNMSVQNFEAGSCKVTSSEENVYVNGIKVTATSGYTFTIEVGKIYQIITQNGTESPYITVLKGV